MLLQYDIVAWFTSGARPCEGGVRRPPHPISYSSETLNLFQPKPKQAKLSPNPLIGWLGISDWVDGEHLPVLYTTRFNGSNLPFLHLHTYMSAIRGQVQ